MKFGLHNIPVVFKIFPILTFIKYSLLNNINTTQTVTIKILCMWSDMSKYLIENFVDIINKEYCLIIGAKYYNSNMNNACTIFLTNIVGHPAKVVQPTTLFSEKKVIFVWLLCWLLAGQLRHQLMKCV